MALFAYGQIDQMSLSNTVPRANMCINADQDLGLHVSFAAYLIACWKSFVLSNSLAALSVRLIVLYVFIPKIASWCFFTESKCSCWEYNSAFKYNSPAVISRSVLERDSSPKTFKNNHKIFLHVAGVMYESVFVENVHLWICFSLIFLKLSFPAVHTYVR